MKGRGFLVIADFDLICEEVLDIGGCALHYKEVFSVAIVVRPKEIRELGLLGEESEVVYFQGVCGFGSFEVDLASFGDIGPDSEEDPFWVVVLIGVLGFVDRAVGVGWVALVVQHERRAVIYEFVELLTEDAFLVDRRELGVLGGFLDFHFHQHGFWLGRKLLVIV